MSQEYETKEVTKTETLYKAYNYDSVYNQIVIVWQKDKPFKVNTTLELATEFLKEDQKRSLKRKIDALKESERTVRELMADVQYWENLVNNEPKVVDKTK